MSIAALQKFRHPHLQGNNRLVYKAINADAFEVIGMIDLPSKGCFF